MRNVGRRLSPAESPLSPSPATERGSPSGSARPPQAESSGFLGGLTALRHSLAPSAASSASAAVRKGDTDTLRTFLQAQPGLATDLDSRRDNLLGVAARAGNLESARALLDHAQHRPGMAPTLLNQRNEAGDTPLTLAIAAGHLDVTRLLLAQTDVDVNLANKGMETPLLLAVARGDVESVKLLISHPHIAPGLPNAKGDTALAIALQGGHYGAATELLKHPDPNLDLNSPNAKGESLLYQATARNDADSVRLLINDRRIDARMKTRDDKNPLDLAMAHERVALVRLLAMDAGLVNEPDRSDRTPFDRAVEARNHPLIKALLESDAVDVNRRSENGHVPLSRALKFIEYRVGTDHDHYLRPRIETLALLVGSNNIDANIHFNDGETLLTGLCKMTPRPDVEASSTGKYFYPTVRAALVEVLAVQGGNLDVNHLNRRGKTALEIAAETGSYLLTSTLFDDKRTDPNVLANWLTANPGPAFNLMSYQSPDQPLPFGDRLNRFVEETLAQWAGPRPDGTPHPRAYLSHAQMGRRAAAEEEAAATPGAASNACAKDALHYFTLALEGCMAFAGSLRRDLHPVEQQQLKTMAQSVLKHLPAHEPFINLKGVDVSRTEVETWAAGRLPDGFINRQIDRAVNRHGQPNVHIEGLTVRGSMILNELRHRVPEQDRLSPKQSIDAIGTAVEASGLPQERQTLIKKGLEFALTQDQRVDEGLNTNVSDVLSTMWSYIQSLAVPPIAQTTSSPQPSGPEAGAPVVAGSEEEMTQRAQMHENLVAALLARLADIGDEPACNTGCVQRILYAPDGVDLSLTGGEPDQEGIGEEIRSLAGQVNERFETLYGPSASDPTSDPHAASTSSAETMSAAERRLVALYQDGQPVDEEAVVKIKQDMLEARVMAELVGRRGWGQDSVRPELDKIKGWMAAL